MGRLVVRLALKEQTDAPITLLSSANDLYHRAIILLIDAYGRGIDLDRNHSFSLIINR